MDRSNLRHTKATNIAARRSRRTHVLRVGDRPNTGKGSEKCDTAPVREEQELEIMGIGVIDVDNRECITLGSVQTPDTKTIYNINRGLVDWYDGYLIKGWEQLQKVSDIVVADAFFSKSTFIMPICDTADSKSSAGSGTMRSCSTSLWYHDESRSSASETVRRY